MRYEVGDIWARADASSILIPTNGTLRSDGRGIMGAGVAKAACERFGDLETPLGTSLALKGNVPTFLSLESKRYLFNLHVFEVWSFPTKHHWSNESDLNLIESSAAHILDVADKRGWTNVILPEVGCGLGGLAWAEVYQSLSRILDDRFLCLHYEGEKSHR